MKVIIQELNDITDSREFLESKPSNVIDVFFCILFLLFISVFIWAYIGEFDNYVKAEGIVRPNNKISVIKNSVSGKVETVNYEEGKKVIKGDILFSIDHDTIDSEIAFLIEEIRKKQLELNDYKKLKEVILEEESGFVNIEINSTDNFNIQRYKDIFNNNNYYNKYVDYMCTVQKFMKQLELTRHNCQTAQVLYDASAISLKELIDSQNALEDSELELKKYQNECIMNINAGIISYQNDIIELEKGLRTLVSSRKNHVITSPIDGSINVITDINKGDFLQNGDEIVRIVPDNNSQYKVLLNVSNKDIAKIKEGQNIRYHFLALPYREFGELKGKVTKIGTDAKTNFETGESYYIVETTANNIPLYGYKGKKAEIKIGMECEAQVITSSKKILIWFLEKIELRE